MSLCVHTYVHIHVCVSVYILCVVSICVDQFESIMILLYSATHLIGRISFRKILAYYPFWPNIQFLLITQYNVNFTYM